MGEQVLLGRMGQPVQVVVVVERLPLVAPEELAALGAVGMREQSMVGMEPTPQLTPGAAAAELREIRPQTIAAGTGQLVE